MKIMLTFLGLLLLMVSFGVARQQQHTSESCDFAVQGEPAQPTVQGPDDIVPLVYVVDQPDSPIEVVSVDLTGMWLSVANEQTTASYTSARANTGERRAKAIQRRSEEMERGTS